MDIRQTAKKISTTNDREFDDAKVSEVSDEQLIEHLV